MASKATCWWKLCTSTQVYKVLFNARYTLFTLFGDSQRLGALILRLWASGLIVLLMFSKSRLEAKYRPSFRSFIQ